MHACTSFRVSLFHEFSSSFCSFVLYFIYSFIRFFISLLTLLCRFVSFLFFYAFMPPFIFGCLLVSFYVFCVLSFCLFLYVLLPILLFHFLTLFSSLSVALPSGLPACLPVCTPLLLLQDVERVVRQLDPERRGVLGYPDFCRGVFSILRTQRQYQKQEQRRYGKPPCRLRNRLLTFLHRLRFYTTKCALLLLLYVGPVHC